MVTTNHVLGETWTFLRRRLGHTEACRFLAAAESGPAAATRRVDEGAEQDAWRWSLRHAESYSLLDATSFATMRRMRIQEALAFNGDLGGAGFAEVRG